MLNSTEFKPAWWLRNRHLQTLWPVFFKRSPKIKTVSERLTLPDGDFVDLAWSGKPENSPIVLVLHGLEGSIDSHYIKGMLLALEKAGCRSVLMHFRGCSGQPNRLARGYHSGETGDLSFLVATLRQREPDAPLAVIGFSLGGNVLLKWLGETGAENPLAAAAAVSVPFQLDQATMALACGFSRCYQWYLLRNLVRSMGRKFAQRQMHFTRESLKKLSTLRDFDDLVTAPLHGFRDASHYYSESSSRQYLKAIEVPTLLVHSLDDPFLPSEAIPTSKELSAATRLYLTSQGGHVGFVSGNWPWRPDYMLERCIPAFLKEHLT